MKISIIIKALNEKEHIASCIKSALASIALFDGEVILSDSGSTDGTIAIAKNFPITIVQLKNTQEKSCGIGAQLGYQHSSGEYIYILDGDMLLDQDFITKALEILLSNPTIAGVAGSIREMTSENMVFNRRQQGQNKIDTVYRKEKSLMMGGLYRAEVIKKAGWFSNPNLHSYEESDLGVRIRTLGYELVRIPHPMVTHYGDKISSFSIFKNRWKSRYLWGCGEYLRAHVFQKTFFEVLYELKLYVGIWVWWLIGLLSVLTHTLRWWILLTMIMLILFLLKKRSIKEWLFSLFSWHITAMGLLCGFLNSQSDPKRNIAYVKLL